MCRARRRPRRSRSPRRWATVANSRKNQTRVQFHRAEWVNFLLLTHHVHRSTDAFDRANFLPTPRPLRCAGVPDRERRGRKSRRDVAHSSSHARRTHAASRTKMAGLLSSMAGLTLTGSFAGAKLRTPTAAPSRVSGGFQVVAVRVTNLPRRSVRVIPRVSSPRERAREGDARTRRARIARERVRDARRRALVRPRAVRAARVRRASTQFTRASVARLFRVRVWVQRAKKMISDKPPDPDASSPRSSSIRD